MKHQLIDLKSITNNSNNSVCRIYIASKIWIVCGSVNIRSEDTCYVIDSKIHKAYDFEHDLAYAFIIPLIGFQFRSVTDNTSCFSAHIHPRKPYTFRVPPPGYNPLQSERSVVCSDCEEKDHFIIPEDLSLPPTNQALYKELSGERIEIYIGPDQEKD